MDEAKPSGNGTAERWPAVYSRNTTAAGITKTAGGAIKAKIKAPPLIAPEIECVIRVDFIAFLYSRQAKSSGSP